MTITINNNNKSGTCLSAAADGNAGTRFLRKGGEGQRNGGRPTGWRCGNHQPLAESQVLCSDGLGCRNLQSLFYEIRRLA